MNQAPISGDRDMAPTGLAAGARDRGTVANQAEVSHHRSRLQQIMDLDHAVTSRSMGKLLAVLLPSAIPDGSSGCDVLRPLWAEEAMHRSYNFIRLALALQQRPRLGPAGGLTCNAELCLATNLAALYRSLVACPERQVVPCSVVLREVVRDLVALFGPIVGDVELHLDIERIALAAFQRRALVLAASELVINALLHAFKGRRHGSVSVELHAIDTWRAGFRVSDNGIGCDDRRIDVGSGIAGGLASLLGSQLLYRSRNGRGTIVELALQLNL
jgi:hypothetical protein